MSKQKIFGNYQLSYQYALHYREDHRGYLAAIKPPGRLYQQLKNNNLQQPIDAGYFIWKGHPEELVTLLTQRAITGLECFLPFALTMYSWVESASGTLEKILWEAMYDPRSDRIQPLMSERFPVHSFSKKNMKKDTHLLYHCLPLLMGVDKPMSDDLYAKLAKFYSEVRNPLAHGAVVTKTDPEPLLATYQLIEEVYLWIETWMPAGIQAGNMKVQWR